MSTHDDEREARKIGATKCHLCGRPVTVFRSGGKRGWAYYICQPSEGGCSAQLQAHSTASDKLLRDRCQSHAPRAAAEKPSTKAEPKKASAPKSSTPSPKPEAAEKPKGLMQTISEALEWK